MDNYTNEELREALREVSSTISKCEKMQGKFVEGTSQYSLLRNRIKAMYISKLLIVNELSKIEQILANPAVEVIQKWEFDRKNVIVHYTKEELTEALPPVVSVISKCEKAQGKFAEGTTHHTRFKNIIKAMYISKSLIEDQLSKELCDVIEKIDHMKKAILARAFRGELGTNDTEVKGLNDL